MLNYCDIIQTLLSRTGLGVIVTDKSGSVLLCNDATSKVLGRKIERVLPEDWPQHYGIYLPDGISICPSAESPLVRAIAGEVVQNMEVRIRQSELSRPTWCTISFEPLRNESEEITGGVLLIKDITSQKNLQYESPPMIFRNHCDPSLVLQICGRNIKSSK
jgi:PAS domain-containing protein